MKEQYLQLGLQHAAFHPEGSGGAVQQRVEALAREVSVFASNRLTSVPETSHTEEREVILMDSRGEVAAATLKPATLERSPQHNMRPDGRYSPAAFAANPEMLQNAQKLPDEVVRDAIGVDVNRFAASKDPNIIARLKAWCHEHLVRKKLEEELHGKRDLDDYVNEIAEYRKMLGNNLTEGEMTELRSAGLQRIFGEAKEAGFDKARIMSALVERDERQAAVSDAVGGRVVEDPIAAVRGDGYVELKQEEAPIQSEIDLSDIPPGELRNEFAKHNEFVSAAGIPYSWADMKETYGALAKLRNSVLYDDDPEVQARQVAAINNAMSNLQSQITRAYMQYEASQQRGYSRYDYMGTGEVFRKLEDGSEVPAKDVDVIIDRKVRDEVFNNLFANADSRTNEFFDRAWNIMTDGGNFETFMGDLRKARQGNISNEALEEWIRQYGSKTDMGKQRNDESDDEYRERRSSHGYKADMKKLLEEELNEDLQRYSKEYNVRKSLHDANAIINIARIDAEQVFGYIEQFGVDLQDYTARMPGVRQMMDIFEMQVRQVMAENNGFLPPDAIQETSVGEVTTDAAGEARPLQKVNRPIIEERSKKLFQEYLDKGIIFLRDEQTGKPIPVSELKPWQVDRIYATARGMSLLSMRLLSLASESTLPPEGQVTSLFLQDVMQVYSPYVHLMSKYHIPTDKALTALLYEPGRKGLAEYIAKGVPDDLSFLKTIAEKLPNIRLPYSRDHLEHMYHTLHDGMDNTRDIMDGKYGSEIKLRMQNPNYCGDAFTYLSWRVGEKPKEFTASQEFLRRGAARMANRVFQEVRGDTDFTRLDLAAHNSHLHYGSIDDPKAHHADETDRIAINVYTEIHGGEGLTEANREEIKQLRDRLMEYGHWVGTGFRFERMRGDLEKWNSKSPADKKDFENAKSKAEPLLQRIVELQPHRMYLKSKNVRARINKQHHYSDEQMQRILANLSFLETRMYQQRENLLDNGHSFDRGFTLQDIYNDYMTEGENRIQMPHEGEWAATQEFMRLMQEDFRQNKDSKGSYYQEHGHEMFRVEDEGYMEEFVYKRDYFHGFVLWSGDAPLEEWSFAKLGGTGGFIRRAGENKDVMRGGREIYNLLAHLHDQFTTPDAVYQQLYKIYSENKNYDATLAKRTVADLAEGIIKFFGETSPARIPVLGEVWERMGHGSFAQTVYGSRVGAIWSTSDVDYFLNDLLGPHIGMYDEVRQEIAKSVNSTRLDHFTNIAQTVALVAAIATALYILKEAAGDAVK